MTQTVHDVNSWRHWTQLFVGVVLAMTPALLSAAEATAERGTMKGRFLYDGKPPKPEPLDTSREPLCKQFNLVDESLVVGADGGLKNVLVFVVSKDVTPRL